LKSPNGIKQSAEEYTQNPISRPTHLRLQQ
jgi:hypothetical protein